MFRRKRFQPTVGPGTVVQTTVVGAVVGGGVVATEAMAAGSAAAVIAGKLGVDVLVATATAVATVAWPFVLVGAAVGATAGVIAYGISSSEASAANKELERAYIEDQTSSSGSRSARSQYGADPPRQTPDPSRGLNTNPSDLRSLKEANKMIVEAMIKYIQALKGHTLAQAARDFIIEQLRKSRPLNEFHLNSTASWGVVQVDHQFEGVTGGGESWQVIIRIDVDNPPENPHMGYEIYIDRRRVQSGHVYVYGLETGRPGFGLDHLLTTDVLEQKNDNLRGKNGIFKGKVEWKCTSTRYKRR